MLKSFAFPFVGLLADVAILHFRGWPSLACTIVALAIFVASNIWLFIQVKNDTDNQWWPSAIATIAPILILAFGTFS